jgi:uncharacterized phage infection (PIP) family protein YhgE
MSTIGKIFILLNFALSCAFLGWAVNATSVSNEWKVKYDKEVVARADEVRTLTGELKQVRDLKTELENNKITLTNQLSSAKNDATRFQEEATKEKADNADLRTSLNKMTSTLDTIEQNRQKLQADKEKAEQAQRDAETAKAAAEAARDTATAGAEKSSGELTTANESIAKLEKEKTALQKESSSLQTQLDTLVANTGAKLGDYAPVPDIRGAVLEVSMAVEPGLIMINRGSADSPAVKRGYTFEIYDGKTYKGQGRVEYVHDHMSSAIITRKVPGQTIRQGDGAATRL